MSDEFTDAELQKAVALYYDGTSAPVISATGTGEIAQQIIDLAEAHEVPLCDNATLVDFLITLELGDAISEKLYLAIAHIIAFAYDLRGIIPEEATPADANDTNPAT
ncbi:EscU/YscU/HrcU family type III secretion system export apparatus switch protein [uncultured Gilvimarinus sp.]|uniref:EscU/YscU/HrcU family type III secretion system export apparatus switch protein n=1 Tax=uncultured Gilvimarinus sp. TaxID=1689143 RepID=UPI0030EC4572